MSRRPMFRNNVYRSGVASLTFASHDLMLVALLHPRDVQNMKTSNLLYKHYKCISNHSLGAYAAGVPAAPTTLISGFIRS
jgi:hypothetical protein